uniref:Protein kinase domain-containing protein n=1 Tax=Panagrolaimus sp. PS1159 TaxID=55785 RepID=A0AC35FAI9_9BILA
METVVDLKNQRHIRRPKAYYHFTGDHDYSDSSSSLSDTTFAILANEQVVYFAVGIIIVILLIFVLILCVYLKTKKRKNRKSTSSDAFIEETGSNRRSTPLTKEITLFDSPSAQPFLQPLTSTPKSCKSTPSTLPIFAAPAPSKAPQIIFQRAQNHLDIKTALVELTADRNLFQVIPGCELEGTFGEVKWAIWRQTPFGASGDIDDEEDGISEDIAVVCKTLKPSADKAHFQKFLQEALAFHNVPPHANLAQVVAAGTYGNFANLDSIKDFPLICYRHQGFGNLKKFLLQCRSSSSNAESIGGTASSRASLGPSQTLRTHELLSMGIQILKAVSHLHKYGIIHKDIATRNCLVSEIPAKISNDRMYVQLCDNALSKDLFPNDYHCLGDNENRPLKWMAPETFKSKVHNSASDVWQFGVVLWELFTCAQQPFSDIEPEEMLAELEQGIRLGQPYNCPDELYGAMYCCWQREALQRPTTGQLLKVLDDFNVQLRKYI